MRYRIIALFVLAAMLPCSVSAKDTPETILASYAAQLGTNRLAKDVGDPNGLTFLRLSAILNPDNETQMLTFAYLQRGKKIKPVKTTYTEEKFATLLVSRTNYLMKNSYKRNPKVGVLSKLYLQVAELIKPDSKEIILGIAKLERKGVSQSLNELLDQNLKAKELLSPPKSKPPAAIARPKVKIYHWGIGYADSYLRSKVYGSIRGKKYINKPNEYILQFYNNNRYYYAYIHFGKCRRIQFNVSSYRLPELEGSTLSEPQGWEKIRAGYYESVDKKLCATYRNGSMNIWEKKWYDKHGDK